MRIFLDANILFSAAKVDSQIARFMAFLRQQPVLCVTSHYALLEAERNIMAKRPEWLNDFHRFIKTITFVPEVTTTGLTIALADKDKPILSAAIGAQCTHLLTSDRRDFGHLYGQTIAGVQIVNAPQLISALNKASSP